jgi:hypothetical protein
MMDRYMANHDPFIAVARNRGYMGNAVGTIFEAGLIASTY